MTGLRNRVELGTRSLPDLALVACLGLLWVAGSVPLWVHLAYICVALSAYTRPNAGGTVLRVLAVTIAGGAALIHGYGQGTVPRQDLFEVPLLATMALLFARFVEQRAQAEQNVLRATKRLARVIDRIPLATIAFDDDARVLTWNTSAEELELSDPLPAVAADLAQLKQVVLNLALNARDAMADGGTLTIETSLVDGSVGTTVEITLPAASGTVMHADEAPAVPTGAERVLVAEDRDVVRNLARDLLESSGFDVVAVPGGREALDAAAAGEPFDLLLTDVVMPEMSGPELAQRLRADRPALPVLYMSGYTDDVLDAHDLAQDATAFLRKPFGNAELIAAIRGVLDGQPGASTLADAGGSKVH